MTLFPQGPILKSKRDQKSLTGTHSQLQQHSHHRTDIVFADTSFIIISHHSTHNYDVINSNSRINAVIAFIFDSVSQFFFFSLSSALAAILESVLLCLIVSCIGFYCELDFLSILYLIHTQVSKYSFLYTCNSYESSYNPKLQFFSPPRILL